MQRPIHPQYELHRPLSRPIVPTVAMSAGLFPEPELPLLTCPSESTEIKAEGAASRTVFNNQRYKGNALQSILSQCLGENIVSGTRDTIGVPES